MNPEQEQELEAEISRALQSLPELAAPPGFFARTMTAIEQRAARAGLWNQWPVSVRVGFIVAGFSVLAGGVFGWRAVEPGVLTAAAHGLAPAVSSVQCVWSVVVALVGAMALAVEHLGKGFIIIGLLAAVTASAMCGGFGAVLLRFALGKSRSNKL